VRAPETRKMTLLTFASLALLLGSYLAAALQDASCTLSTSGGDDGPAFVAAALSSSCPTVTVPVGTTLSIATKMNMTGLSNKHIVGRPHASPHALMFLCQSIQGTVAFTANVSHWIAVSTPSLSQATLDEPGLVA
jgi:galacturan 1,4-alpha-galacturonidase